MPEYPFGMDRPFNGFDVKDPKTHRVTFSYRPNAKQWIAHNCCCDEVAYGGAVWGGKSRWILTHNQGHCAAYGSAANTVLFRRTYDELEGTLIREQKEFFDGKLGHYLSGDKVFRWSNGATTWFRHMEEWKDVEKHQGRSYTLMAFDEATQFEQRMIDRLTIWLRAAGLADNGAQIHCQLLLATNPRGVGHKWFFDRYIDGKDTNRPYIYIEPEHNLGDLVVPERRVSRIFVPARCEDNKEGQKMNPGYLGQLREGRSDDEYRAFVMGDWALFEGRAFPEWNPAVHIIRDFTIPKTWKVIRAIDWGYASPFSIGWYAQDADAKTVYRIDEWYGAQKGPKSGVSGLNMAVQDIRQGLKDRESANKAAGAYPEPWYGVGDPSIWAKTTSEPSVGFELNKEGALFKAGERDRLVGKQTIHSLLRMNPQTGKPGFQVFASCREFIRTIPMLVLDEADMKTVDTKQEDHIYDEWRYAMVELMRGGGKRPSLREQMDERRMGALPMAV